jgi:hypothetical protein
MIRGRAHNAGSALSDSAAMNKIAKDLMDGTSESSSRPHGTAAITDRARRTVS